MRCIDTTLESQLVGRAPGDWGKERPTAARQQ
jgi:hypothetical protein